MIIEFHCDLDLEGQHVEELDVAVDVRRTDTDAVEITRFFVKDFHGRDRVLIDVSRYDALCALILRRALTEELGSMSVDLGFLGDVRHVGLPRQLDGVTQALALQELGEARSIGASRQGVLQ